MHLVWDRREMLTVFVEKTEWKRVLEICKRTWEHSAEMDIRNTTGGRWLC
jgi:hypothetical protein